ncbi:FtsX-like permease family protein [Flexivirga caeni]|uniref:FtsX-like permease family protein n=1 Tax=Flexivirga caeni TaxID=2294115 RepID=UPI001315A1DE|nr:FtsX-like permease family protein [Flexivirga caeni]
MRLAARDIRKHRGRAVLVVLLIGLPLLFIAAGGTFAFTNVVSPREGIPRTMGASQARLTVQGSDAIVQDWSGVAFGMMDGNMPKTLHFRGDPKSPTARDIQGVTGGTVLPVTWSQPYVVLAHRSMLASTLGIDGRRHAYDGMARLTAGRWPRTADEVLVSRAGAADGIPTHGTLTLHSGGMTRTVTVVGRADTPNAQSLVALPSGRATSWVLDRKSPVRWPEVKELNRYGLLVASRSVIEHPGQAQADPGNQFLGAGDSGNTSLLILLGTGLVLVIALLAGPAFAASGARHRRALGQLASNGASKAQLRRYVLAQALLLGALSAIIGLVLGAACGWLAVQAYAHWSPTSAAPGPLDLRFGWGLILLAVAVFASLTAAFVPAVAASRVNLIAVLRGHVSVAKVRAGWPIAGLVIAAVGAVLLPIALVASEGRDGDAADTSPLVVGGIILGSVSLFVGTLMTAPWLLARLGSLAGHFPLPLRIAVRDIGRQRGRAVATTGAILATVAVLTTTAITLASNNRAMQEAYQPSLPMGQALVTATDGAAVDPDAIRVIRDQLPRAALTELRSVGSPSASGGGNDGDLVQVTAGYQSGCSDTQALAGPGDSSCSPVFAPSWGNLLVAATPAQLARVFALSANDVAALRAGRVLLPGGPAAQKRAMTVVTGTGRLSSTGPLQDARVTAKVSVPVALSPQPFFTMQLPQRTTNDGQSVTTYGSLITASALISTDAAAKLPGGSYLAGVLIRNPGGVPRSAAQTISDRLNGPAGSGDILYVERGYQDVDNWIWLVIGIVFGLLVLVATLTSTALSNAESRADSATFASLGAPSRLRRLIAGSNAAAVGLFGALLGLVVGCVAGYAASHPATRSALGGHHHTITVIPWAMLLAVAIGIPLLAGALAALATRGRVPMTRRLT